MQRFVLLLGLTAASVGCDGSSQSASPHHCQKAFVGHSGYVCTVAFTPNGKQLISGGADGKIKFWCVDSGECQRTLDGHAEWVHSVAISADGKFLASGGRDNLVKLWDIATGKLLKTFTGHSGLVKSVAYSPDGRLLASCGGDKSIRIWDIASGEGLKTIDSDSFFTLSMVVFTPDSKQVLLAGDSLQLWDIETGTCVCTFDGHSDSVGEVAISRNGRWIASVGSYTDRSLRLWDAKSGDCLWMREFTEQDGERAAWTVTFAPQDDVLVSGQFDGSIKYWDVNTAECLCTVAAHTESVSSVAVDLKGGYLASGSWDKTIKLWKPPSAKTTGQ
ncbi:MAG: WD40 repeat domain-containing protein [Pirellulales bacterium]|nr:WD40 repeat domain-containing protein [Pirellulales bacterium]